MVTFKIYLKLETSVSICGCVVNSSADCVTCLWLTSDFSQGCDGQFRGAHSHLCYSKGKGAPLAGTQGMQAEGIITLGPPSTNRALEPHKCSRLLSFRWKILEDIPYTSQRSSLHQQPSPAFSTLTPDF